MEPQRRVQVVLGEAERADGLLRFVLEAEGFDLVGLASSDEELERVLRGARPAVVVLDGGISAAAALHARECLEDAAIVVVWPDGVSAMLAEERVEPNLVIEDLGDAVRRAADRVRPPLPPIVVPEAEDDDDEIAFVEPLPTDPPRAPRPSRPERQEPRGRRLPGRKMQVLVAAATWVLVIGALAAIATAVPHVVDTFRGGRNSHPSPSITTDPQGQTDARSDETAGEQQRDPCADPVNGEGNDAGQGNGAPVRAQGCPPKQGGGGKAGGGRPDDPGSRGNGGSSGIGGTNGGSSGDAGSAEDPVSHGSSEEEHGASASGSSTATDPTHGRAGEAGHGRHA